MQHTLFDSMTATIATSTAACFSADRPATATSRAWTSPDVEICPRALDVLRRHLALRAEYVAAGKIRHEHLFFLEDGCPISDPEITRWRWSESIKALNIQRRGPYHARHSSVTW
jgi:hypothetical protein